jgi:hypothetical protein
MNRSLLSKTAVMVLTGALLVAIMPWGGNAAWEMDPPDGSTYTISATYAPPTFDGYVMVGTSWSPDWFVGHEYVATDPDPVGDVYMVVHVDAEIMPIDLYIGGTVAPYGYEKGDGSWIRIDWDEDGIVDVEQHVPPGLQSLTDAEWQVAWGIIDMTPRDKNPYEGEQMTPEEVGDCFDVIVHEDIIGYPGSPGSETTTFPGRPEAGPFKSTQVCVNWNPAPPPTPGEDGFRTIGFWKHQCRTALGENKGHQHINSETLNEYLELIADSTTVPELGEGGDSIGIEGMCDILDLKGKQDMKARALQQLLALWLNYANGAGDWDTMVDSDWDCTPDITLGDAIVFIENIVNDPNSTHQELETAKDMADSINNSDHC